MGVNRNCHILSCRKRGFFLHSSQRPTRRSLQFQRLCLFLDSTIVHGTALSGSSQVRFQQSNSADGHIRTRIGAYRTLLMILLVQSVDKIGLMICGFLCSGTVDLASYKPSISLISKPLNARSISINFWQSWILQNLPISIQS